MPHRSCTGSSFSSTPSSPSPSSSSSCPSKRAIIKGKAQTILGDIVFIFCLIFRWTIKEVSINLFVLSPRGYRRKRREEQRKLSERSLNSRTKVIPREVVFHPDLKEMQHSCMLGQEPRNQQCLNTNPMNEPGRKNRSFDSSKLAVFEKLIY